VHDTAALNAHARRCAKNRWDSLENNPTLQAYTNYGLGFAYGAIALVALVSSVFLWALFEASRGPALR